LNTLPEVTRKIPVQTISQSLFRRLKSRQRWKVQ